MREMGAFKALIIDWCDMEKC